MKIKLYITDFQYIRDVKEACRRGRPASEVGVFEDFKTKIICGLKLKISDEKFIAGNRRFSNRLTRQRSLPFHLLVWLILQKTNQSLQVGLDDFFDLHVHPLAMEGLSGIGARRFYLATPWQSFFAKEAVQLSWLWPKADAGHWISRISYLYDVFNGIVFG